MWSWFLARLKGIFNRIASVIIFLVLLIVVFAVIGAFTQPKIPSEMVLTLDVRDGLPDQRPNNPFVDKHRILSVIDAVTALAKAENDDHVKGLFLRVGGGGISSSEAQELSYADLRSGTKRISTR